MSNIYTAQTAQTGMVKNHAGKSVFKIDQWDQLDRFLILGSDTQTYYATAQKMAGYSVKLLDQLLAVDGVRLVNQIVNISTNRRAPRENHCNFALAYALKKGDLATRQAASRAVAKVCRTGTSILMFTDNVNALGGFGRLTRTAIGNWYTDKTPAALAYQVLKYKSRKFGDNTWRHADVLRLTHPNGDAGMMSYLTKGNVSDTLPSQIQATEALKEATDADEVVAAIKLQGLVREMIPTNFLNEKAVWEALLQKMPIGATVRNLGKMSSLGLFTPMSTNEAFVCHQLRNVTRLKGIHPYQVLTALAVYKSGHGHRGNLSWDVNREIVSALEDAFELAFDTIVPTNKRWYIGLDVSGSMGWSYLNNSDLISAREAAAAMAMVTMRTEKQSYIAGFTHRLTPLDITRNDSLSTVIRKTSNLPFGATDMSLPMIDALEKEIEADVFVIYTDNEVNSGQRPDKALAEYRRKTGINAKLIVVGMTATEFTIANPNDAGMMDVVGFDTFAPKLMADFVRSQWRLYD